MLNEFSLKGETALITGGGNGLGFGIAECFVAAGARVVLVGRRADVLQRAAKKLGKAATFEPHDILAVEEAENLVKWVSKSAGPISILVNNAGIHLKKSATETTPAEFNSVLQTHVVAAFSLTRAVLPQMIKQKRGNILFTASMASIMGIPLVVAYSAAKSAYLGMVRSLATEVSPQGVRVNAIAPGWIESEMMLNALNGDPKRSNKILGRTPMNCFGTPRDIGLAATYLCSPAARFVTGVLLPVDGGVSIGF
ncbi:MAG TPA: SDR family oxidoreductase [Candidatus Acidoferrales bacterium]|jgi:NAD(P)-dependent dehydrogenase (short-subunit alcohol dehydrogenase family)|nr:SDR family oxidoreductase [Candidatus Acidoferrales bacterium]